MHAHNHYARKLHITLTIALVSCGSFLVYRGQTDWWIIGPLFLLTLISTRYYARTFQRKHVDLVRSIVLGAIVFWFSTFVIWLEFVVPRHSKPTYYFVYPSGEDGISVAASYLISDALAGVDGMSIAPSYESPFFARDHIAVQRASRDALSASAILTARATFADVDGRKDLGLCVNLSAVDTSIDSRHCLRSGELTGDSFKSLISDIVGQLGKSLPSQAAMGYLSSNPEANYYFLLGLKDYLELTKGGLGAAIGSYRRALEIDGTFEAARAGLAETLAQLAFRGFDLSDENVEDALRLAKQAVRSDENQASCHKALGICYLAKYKLQFWKTGVEDLGLLDAAKQSTLRAVNLRPNYPMALNNMIYISAELRDFSAAHRYFARCLDLAPYYFLPHVNEGYTLALENRLDEAVRVLKTAIRLSPEETGLGHLVLSRVYAKQGQYELAAEILDALWQYRDFNYSFVNEREPKPATDVDLKRVKRHMRVSTR